VAGGVVVDPSPTERQLENMRATLEATGKRFLAAVEASGRRVEWRASLDFPTEYIMREARAADLVIIGRQWAPMDPYRSLDPGSLVLKVGRPVLVVPEGITSLSAKKIMIAWKDVREARRAVLDAVPFLREAASVMLVEVVEAGVEQQAFHRLKDVARFLERHHITIVSERVLASQVTTTDSLLRWVEDNQSDLIVAGAYGHSRLGEWIFGGVTRDLLAASPVCCFLSH
jgi:nucleotide-binding universal stress UspA family protein